MGVSLGAKLGRLINANQNDNYTDAFRPFLRMVDQLVQSTVLNHTLSAPPSLPADGNAYIVAASPTGLWAGKAGCIAVYSTQITTLGANTTVPGWEFYTPNEGFRVWESNIKQVMRYTLGAWTTAQQGFADEEVPGGNVDGVNNTYTLLHVPNPPSSLKVYLGGQRMVQGASADYQFVSGQIVYNTAPNNGLTHTCDYRY